MDGLAARLPAAARPSLVHCSAGPSTSRPPSSGGGSPTTPTPTRSSSRAASSRRRRRRGLRRGGRHVGLARPRGEEGHDLWLRAMGRSARDRKAGLLHPDGVLLGRWRGAYLRHHGPEHVLCFAPTRSGKGVGLVVPTLLDLAGLGHRPRHQGRELGADRRLASAVRPRAAVRSDQHAKRRLQSAARGPPRRMGGARRPEHRRRAGRSRRRAGEAKPLGEDEPLAARRHDPACPLRRGGQDARRRRQFPLRSQAADRDDAARDDDDAASGRSGRPSRRRQRRARTAEQDARTNAPACCRPPCRSSASIAIRSSPPSRGAATGASAISSKPSARDALSRRAAVGHQPDQAADPPDPQSDRPAPHRGTGVEAPVGIGCC